MNSNQLLSNSCEFPVRSMRQRRAVRNGEERVKYTARNYGQFYRTLCSVTSKYIKGDGLPYTRMHASRCIAPRAPLARAIVRDAIDLSPRVALTSWIFSYSFQPAACPDATNSTDTAVDPTNACEYMHVYIYIYIYIYIYARTLAYKRTCYA